MPGRDNLPKGTAVVGRPIRTPNTEILDISFSQSHAGRINNIFQCTRRFPKAGVPKDDGPGDFVDLRIP